MSTIHRTLDGNWAECSDPTCDLKFHFGDITLAEIKALPMAALLPLLEAMDPPTHVENGEKRWLEDKHQALHRDYDLPALICADGNMYWVQVGVPHRANDMPQSVRPNENHSWYRHGEYYADTKHPETIPEGWQGSIW